jgi:hypothetical protein
MHKKNGYTFEAMLRKELVAVNLLAAAYEQKMKAWPVGKLTDSQPLALFGLWVVNRHFLAP